jgi:hypothetical protein
MSMIGNYRRITADELQILFKQPEKLDDLLYSEEGSFERCLDIDKAWHAIHFLLNGEVWDGIEPYNMVVLGGEPISEEDVGYGPARYLTREQVKVVAKALSDITKTELLERFDAEAFNKADIYPQGIQEDQDYIVENYKALVRFFNQAAESDDAMIIYIS